MSEFDLEPLKVSLTKFIPQGQSALLPALHTAQRLYGYLPEPAVSEVARALQVPLSEVYGVIDFYALFYREPVGKTVIHVCSDPACAIAGGEDILSRIVQHIETLPIGTEVGSVTVERAPCLGLCEHAPAMLVQGAAVGEASEATWDELVGGKTARPQSLVNGTIRKLTANCGRGRTTSLVEYVAGGGYQALRKALQQSPLAIIQEVKASGLVGRGGAAFPTGVKWEGAFNAPGQVKYVVCNADEAEPGTFKDRVMMEDDPQRVLEGLILAAYAITAEKGYWYIRGEYEHAYEVVDQALKEARHAGYLGNNILGSTFSFDVELRQGAGAYVCGEETAQFESIEGKRGFPRVKPPFPTTNGLFGKPTIINNVETLCNVPLVILEGADGYHKTGTQKSPGPKLFCLSGDISRPGLYEVPFGFPFRKLLDELAGGIRPGHTFQAALFGGAAGAFATAADLDLPLTFEDLRAAGLPLGSGVITVLDETRDVREVLLGLGRFFAGESCGKCFPCQIGTQRQYEILERIASGKALPGDVRRLQDIGATMTDSSLCGLGQTAASAVLSAIQHWPGLFAESEVTQWTR
jgi:NADH-quinone oxidoreductase subunit F